MNAGIVVPTDAPREERDNPTNRMPPSPGRPRAPTSWWTVGRAGLILDNLIAAGKAKPTIVVMPAGHTGPFNFDSGVST